MRLASAPFCSAVWPPSDALRRAVLEKIAVNTTSKILSAPREHAAGGRLRDRAPGDPGCPEDGRGLLVVGPRTARATCWFKHPHRGFLPVRHRLRRGRLGGREVHEGPRRDRERQHPPNHVFTRCLNYALRTLGAAGRRRSSPPPGVGPELIADAGHGQRFALMFAGTALGSLINHNLTRVEMIAYLRPRSR